MFLFFKNWNLIYNSDVLWITFLWYFLYLGLSTYLTELVKPIKLMNCFLGSDIEAVIALNLKKIKLEKYFLDGFVIWINKSPNTNIPD